MVQVQSTWFPLYDRNPQTFVPNIMYARPENFVKATQRIWHTSQNATLIELPNCRGCKVMMQSAKPHSDRSGGTV